MKIKTIRLVTLTFSIIAAFALSASAQSSLPGPGESCTCTEVGHCSASQTCPDGYAAVCVCSATGCSSSCSKISGFMDLSEASLVKKLEKESVDKFGSVLSKAFKKVVTFKAGDPNFKFDFPLTHASKGSHWDVLEYLAKNGDLLINGHDIDFWKGVRQNLQSGGGFKLCAGPVSASLVVDELSFISGVRYSIVAGDPQTKVTGPFTGNTVSDIVNSISEQGKVTIAQK